MRIADKEPEFSRINATEDGFKGGREKFPADVDLEGRSDASVVLKVTADVPDAPCIRHRECGAIAPEYTQAERTLRLAGCGASP
jgi:hypothetical protein